jgi:hypothetical protein
MRGCSLKFAVELAAELTVEFAVALAPSAINADTPNATARKGRAPEP